MLVLPDSAPEQSLFDVVCNLFSSKSHILFYVDFSSFVDDLLVLVLDSSQVQVELGHSKDQQERKDDKLREREDREKD